MSAAGIAAYQHEWPSLQGPHNLQNAAIAAALVQELGLSREQVLQGLASFRGLSHRMEVLGTFGGVLVINDSKATNPASTAPALAAWPPGANGAPRIHWICGGMAKTDNLDECAPFFGHIAAAYTIGEASTLFAELLGGHVKVEPCEMLSEAASRALKAAQPSDVILLSPACASFDQFRDYEVRGDTFRDFVAGLTGSDQSEALFAGKSAA